MNELFISMKLNVKSGSKSVLQLGYKQMPIRTALKIIRDLQARVNEENEKQQPTT